MSADRRFLELGEEIPPLLEPPPSLSFVTYRQSGTTIWLAGHSPSRHKRPPEFDFVGKIGRDLTRRDGYAAARLVGLNLLVTLRHALGSLDRIRQVLTVTGAINSGPGFTDQSYVLNGCSDLFEEIFGSTGKPARMAFGASELPFDMAVEANLVAEVAPD